MSSTLRPVQLPAEHDPLADLEQAADLATVPADRVPALLARVQSRIGALHALEAALVARLLSEVSATRPPQEDRLVPTSEAVRLTGMSEDWVREHARELGAVRNGNRLRFSSARLQRFIRERTSVTMPGGRKAR